MFYTFYQHNPDGSFVRDLQRGISHDVFIEANSYQEAISIASRLGIKIAENDEDLSERWYGPDKDSFDGIGLDPTLYGKSIIDYGYFPLGLHDMGSVHYICGKIEIVKHGEKLNENIPGKN